MRRFLLALSFLIVAAPAFAQLPSVIEGLQNPLVVAGAGYLTSDPGPGSSRVRFVLTANIPAIKPLDTLPLYVGGVGIDLRTLDPVLGSVTGVGVSVPLVTYAPNGGQFVLQVGWAHDISGDPTSGSIYFGGGFSLTSPTTLRAKRLAKTQKKAEDERNHRQCIQAEEGPCPAGPSSTW